MNYNNMLVLAYLSENYEYKESILGKLLTPFLGLAGIAFLVEIFTDILIDIWEALFVVNLIVLIASTVVMIFFNYLLYQQSLEKLSINEKDSKEKKYNQQMATDTGKNPKGRRYAVYTIILLGISTIVGYGITSVLWETIFSDFFFDLGQDAGNSLSKLFYYSLFCIFIIVDELLKMIIFPVGQLILLFISNIIFNTKSRTK